MPDTSNDNKMLHRLAHQLILLETQEERQAIEQMGGHVRRTWTGLTPRSISQTTEFMAMF